MNKATWIIRKKVSFVDESEGNARIDVNQHRLLDSENTSFLKLREQQVTEMIAGKKATTAATTEWPEPSAKTLERWLEKHPAYNTFSKRYMVSQRRLLFLADVNPTNRFEQFERICFQRNLAPTTAESYWTTWLGIQKAIGIPPCDADARTTKILKARSTAYPVSFPKAMTQIQMDLFIETFKKNLPSFTAIAALAFFNGQRISDMIQLAVADVTPKEEHMMITVRRGKTMSVSTPYTLWMRRNNYPTEVIIETANAAKANNRLFLFSELNSEEERTRVLNVIRDMITSIDEELELRSFRRGGLQNFAQKGFSLAKILQFSRHSDVPMLMRYLGWGQHAIHRQNEMMEMIDSVTGFKSDVDEVSEEEVELTKPKRR